MLIKMFGLFSLEGSGFTICLGIILLLTGIVMYYCKSKITQTEHKLNSMFGLITDLHEEMSDLKAHIQHANDPAAQDDDTSVRKLNIDATGVLENDNDSAVESDEESDAESDDESDAESDAGVESVANVEMRTTAKGGDTPFHESHQGFSGGSINESSFLNHPYSELIPRSSESDQQSDESDSQSEDDTDGENNIKVVDLGEIEELSVENLDDPAPVGNETPGKVEDEEPINYSNLKVGHLRQLVKDRQLASNVNKIRKLDLVQLLESSA